MTKPLSQKIDQKQLTKHLSAMVFFLFAGFSIYIQPVHAAGDFSFIVISDVPYSVEEEKTLDNTVVPAIKKSGAPFVIHMGDFKSGSSSCTRKLMTARRDQILSLHPGRVFYTPGDNDWTDCDRKKISLRFSELDRLALLRQLFYATPHQLSPVWAYVQQPLYPENMQWSYNDVFFTTVHLVSTNNGRQEILLDDEVLALDRVDARDRANSVWLKSAFDRAKRLGALAIVVATQADVTNSDFTEECSPTVRQKCDAFLSFGSNLKNLAAEFKKPVLLIHGDTNPYCLDKGFGGTNAPNLWRFNSTGDYSFVDAVNIGVNTGDQSDPFRFTSLLREKSPANSCD